MIHMELSTCGTPNRIDVRFPYSKEDVARIKSVGGATFVRSERRQDPHWHVPLDMNTCRRMRQAFGKAIEIGPALHTWATNTARIEGQLGKLALADTAALSRLPLVLSTAYQAVHLGPQGRTMTAAERAAGLAGPGSYQAADVAFLASAQAPLNANQPGLGKTLEWISAVWEAGLEDGWHLVVAPKAAVEGTWEDELLTWQADAPKEVLVGCCYGSRSQREACLATLRHSQAPVKWVVVNPEMIQYDKGPNGKIIVPVYGDNKKSRAACKCSAHRMPHNHYSYSYPELFDVQWSTICIDECHKGSVRNHRSITAQSLNALRLKENGKRCAMSGTPMKKKGADIWGTLHYLRPDVFTSYWRFAESYFDIEDNGFGKKVGELLRDRADAFFDELKPYVLRRIKSECAPWLPPKQYVEVWCSMSTAQAKQYKEMEEEGRAVLDDATINTTSILAEFTRLKQFANAKCRLVNGKVVPTDDSGKLEALLAKLEEYDLFDNDIPKKQKEQHVIFSQYLEVIEWLAEHLRARGVRVAVLSGKQNKPGERKAIKDLFQSKDITVLCIVTSAGGVSLTLDSASTAHFFDESWAPDETEQAEDRIHRVSRNHQVTIYQYRTRDTIDDYIMETADGKREAQKFILDVRREVLAAQGK